MNIPEHLLTCLAEEGGEITQAATKALRFGLLDYPHEGAPNNTEQIVAELNDLLGVARLLVARGVLPPDWQSEDKQKAKMVKVTNSMGYAQSLGTLQP